jgi:hypothetical protein
MKKTTNHLHSEEEEQGRLLSSLLPRLTRREDTHRTPPLLAITAVQERKDEGRESTSEGGLRQLYSGGDGGPRRREFLEEKPAMRRAKRSRSWPPRSAPRSETTGLGAQLPNLNYSGAFPPPSLAGKAAREARVRPGTAEHCNVYCSEEREREGGILLRSLLLVANLLPATRRSILSKKLGAKASTTSIDDGIILHALTLGLRFKNAFI